VGRVAYANLFAVMCPSREVTVTVASPGVFTTLAAHGYSAGDVLYFMTTGALPTGLTAGTTAYYVIATGLTTTSFRVSTISGGTAVNTSGTQSGTHTVYNAPFGFGNGSTTFNVPDLRGEFLRGLDNARGADPNTTIVNGVSSSSTRMLGTTQSHAVQNMTGGVDGGGRGASGVFSLGAVSIQVDGDDGGVSFPSYNISMNASSQINASTETRPRNVAVLACIKY
jgi:phage-related tail fiber protein